ncbi:hypothetical protein EIP86_008863 [Pleurotus ostreatoroseus]|nr:hypothetical protein EIP86_008863 [Pleurotus ostreatoroseus]
MGPPRVRFTEPSDFEDDPRAVCEDPEDDSQSELSEVDDARSEPDISDDDARSEQADFDDDGAADSPDLSSSDSEHDRDEQRFEEEVEQRQHDKVLELREQTCIVQEQDSDTECKSILSAFYEPYSHKRHYPRSPVNERKWPVPLPKEIDKNLRRVRYELLNYGAEYAWLDVLCLRQEDRSKGGRIKNERLKKEEYKTDVPTIGYVYERPKEVVTYFSGLGLPFRATKLDDERHWLKRAWTLQEIHPNPLIGGLTVKQQLTEFERSRSSKGGDVDEGRFFKALARAIDFAEDDYDVFDVLHRMRMRKAESELDKVCGMAYLLKSGTRSTLPTYETDEDAADAWYRLVRSIDRQYRAELFFLFPAEGTRKGHRWVPSWEQIQDAGRLPNPGSRGITVPNRKKGYIKYEHNAHRFSGLCIDDCKIEGLAAASKKCRHGTLVVKVNRHDPIRLAVTAHHQELISEEKDYGYVLLGTYDLVYWVVGRMTNSKAKKFKKVSVVRLEDEDDRAQILDHDLASEISINLA